MIYLGADHRGVALKAAIKPVLNAMGKNSHDFGAHRLNRTDDYPVIAREVARAVAAHPGSMGILLCGSGNGMVMAANRFPGIRAALTPDVRYAKKAREDEDANILVLPALWVTPRRATAILRVWLRTPFSGLARHRRRIRQLSRR